MPRQFDGPIPERPERNELDGRWQDILDQLGPRGPRGDGPGPRLQDILDRFHGDGPGPRFDFEGVVRNCGVIPENDKGGTPDLGHDWFFGG